MTPFDRVKEAVLTFRRAPRESAEERIAAAVAADACEEAGLAVDAAWYRFVSGDERVGRPDDEPARVFATPPDKLDSIIATMNKEAHAMLDEERSPQINDRVTRVPGSATIAVVIDRVYYKDLHVTLRAEDAMRDRIDHNTGRPWPRAVLGGSEWVPVSTLPNCAERIRG